MRDKSRVENLLFFSEKAVYTVQYVLFMSACSVTQTDGLRLSRETRGEEQTVTVKPGHFNSAAFCYTDPHHRTPALQLAHFQTSFAQHAGRFKVDVKKGKYFFQPLSPNSKLERKLIHDHCLQKLFQAFSLNREMADA